MPGMSDPKTTKAEQYSRAEHDGDHSRQCPGLGEVRRHEDERGDQNRSRRSVALFDGALHVAAKTSFSQIAADVADTMTASHFNGRVGMKERSYPWRNAATGKATKRKSKTMDA